MARVTTEDCAKVVGNKFDLVLLSAQRVRQLLAGGSLLVKDVDAPREKNTVLALRDIGTGSVDVDALRDSLVLSLREFTNVASGAEETDDDEEETYDPYLALAAMEDGAVVSSSDDDTSEEEDPLEDIDGTEDEDSDDLDLCDDEE